MSKKQKAIKVTVAATFIWLIGTLTLLGLTVLGSLVNATKPMWLSIDYLTSLSIVCGINLAIFAMCVIGGALMAVLYMTYVRILQVIDGI